MRQSIAGIALISRQVIGRREWLAQWNNRWKCFTFVGGHKHDDETFRQCVIREIEEELHLQHEKDFLVAPTVREHPEYSAWSKGAQEETTYNIELFDVTLRENADTSGLTELPNNRWLSEDEIDRETCADGKAVSETMKFLLEWA